MAPHPCADNGSAPRVRFRHEEVASIPATIPAIDIAEVIEAKRWPASRNLQGRGNGDGNIDDRFSVEFGHCCASRVPNIQHVTPNVLLNEASFLPVIGSPARTERYDLYDALLETDHATSLEPGLGYC
jgi:hypothetical protein